MDNRKLLKKARTPRLEVHPGPESPEFERELKMLAELLLDIYIDKRRRGATKRDPEF